MAFLIFGLYAVTASPVMGWYDAPEFVAAAASLGVPHSPGHPLPVLLGRLGTLLPVGDMAFRVNLISALAGAGAAVAMLAAGRRVLARAAPDISPRTRELAAVAVALLYALSWAAWHESVRAEVYAFTALLCAAALALVLAALAPLPSPARDRPARLLPAAGLITGLALATHHFIALTFFVPAALALLIARDDRGRAVLDVRRATRTAVLGMLGLAVLLQLPVRAARHPVVDWGAPHTAERFVWTVSAQAFHKATTNEQVSPPAEDLAQVLAALVEHATWLLALAALLGLYLGLRLRATRPATLALAGIAAFGAGGRVLVGFDPQIPDAHGYLLPAVGAVLLLGLTGLAILAQQAAAHARVAAILLLLPLPLLPWQLARVHARADLARAHASDTLARWEIDALPPRALLLPAYYQTSFRLWALRAVEHARPDLAVLDRSLLTYPGMAGEARRAHPDLAPLIDAPVHAGAPLPLALLRAAARTRPVRLQLHPNLGTAADPWLLPAGPFAALVADDPPADALRTAAEGSDDAARRDLAARVGLVIGDHAAVPGDHAAVRDALLWHDSVRMDLFCRQRRARAAQMALDHAWSLAPGDTTLRELGIRCGLRLP